MCLCGAQLAGVKTFPTPPFANSADASLSSFVLPAKHPSVLVRGRVSQQEPQPQDEMLEPGEVVGVMVVDRGEEE